MIVLNDRVFAENAIEFKEQIAKGHPCFGFAERHHRSIRFFDLKRHLIGVINENGLIGAAEVVDGEVWDSTAVIKGVGPIDCLERQALINSLSVKAEPQSPLEMGYWYK